MKKNPLGRSGLQVSALSLGTMNFGADWHKIGAIDDKTASSLLDLAIERGVNLIDTADIYGRGAAEEMLGRLLKGRRKKLLLATKVLGQMDLSDPMTGGLSARWITKALEGSLKRLKTDHLDLYMPHGWDFDVPLEETLGAFEAAVKAGKVRVLGCSNFSGEQLLSASGRFSFDQVQYSLIARFPESDLVPVAQKQGVSLLAWVRASISFRRLVFPMRRAPMTQSESREPSRMSRRRVPRPKKFSPRTQLPAMKGLRTLVAGLSRWGGSFGA